MEGPSRIWLKNKSKFRRAKASSERFVDLWLIQVILFQWFWFAFFIYNEKVTSFCSLEEFFEVPTSILDSLTWYFMNLGWNLGLRISHRSHFLTKLLKIEPDLHGWISSPTVRVWEFKTVLFWNTSISWPISLHNLSPHTSKENCSSVGQTGPWSGRSSFWKISNFLPRNAP